MHPDCKIIYQSDRGLLGVFEVTEAENQGCFLQFDTLNLPCMLCSVYI